MARRSKARIVPEAPQPKQPETHAEPIPLNRGDWALGAAVAAAAALLYGLTAARDLILGDTPELMTAAATLGVAHPPGYPLFTMLGFLFSRLPFGAIPFRLNLMAVTCGVGAVLLVYLTALFVTRNRVASAGAALVLATTPLFWSWSLVAEVFAVNNLLAAAMICLLVVWYESPTRGGFLAGAALVSGLALSNQQTIVLLGPAVLHLLWLRRDVLLANPRIVATSAAALAIGLLPYAYLPWAASRNPPWNWGDPVSWESFVQVITRSHFGSGRLTNEANYSGGSPIDRVMALSASFGLLAGLLLIMGAVEAWRRRRWYFWFSVLAFAFAGPAFVSYANMNLAVPLLRSVLERFYLLSHVVTAPLMAFGVIFAGEWLASAVPRVRGRATELATAAILLATLGVVASHYREIDQSRNHAARLFAEDLLNTLKPNSIVIANGDEVIMPLAFLLYAEHYRPDVTLLVSPFLRSPWYVQELRRRESNLTIPFSHYDGVTGTWRALFDANRGRPIAVNGVAEDASLQDHYWFYRRGLVADVEPMGQNVTLDEMLADINGLMARYRLPSPETVKPHGMEIAILDHYATPAVLVAKQLQLLGFNRQAREWYQRALVFDPGLSNVREMLAQVPQ